MAFLRTHWRDLISLLVIFILSFFSLQPLFSPGFFSMHDPQQVARLFELDRALAFGQFPVRWVENLGFGYGYPLFNFYPPLIYYLGEVFHLGLNLGFIDSIKLVWAVGLIGSAFTMYYLAKEFFGKIAGVVAALFYLYAPYHALDAYVRGALAELFSFVWLPLILLFAYRTAKTGTIFNSLLTGIFLSLLLLTHNLIFLPFLFFFTIWYIFFAIAHQRKTPLRGLVLFLVIAIVTVGLTSFFTLPALLEKKFTLVDQLLIKNLASYKIHFVCLSQLWESPWGFGGSAAGCVDGFSLKVGKLHLIVAAVSFIGAIAFRPKRYRVFVIALLLVFSLFMTTNYSKFFWDSISPIWYLQFPWRFLEFVTLFSAILSAAVVFNIKKISLRLILAIALSTAVITINARLFVPREYYPWQTDEILTSREELSWFVSSTSFEYMSSKTSTRLSPLKTVQVDIDKDEIANQKINVVSGDFEEEKSSFAPDRFVLSGKSTTGSQLRLAINDFPGWEVFFDGKKINHTNKNRLAQIELLFPPGTHKVSGKFSNTPIRTVANSISLVAIGVILFSLYETRRRQI